MLPLPPPLCCRRNPSWRAIYILPRALFISDKWASSLLVPSIACGTVCCCPSGWFDAFIVLLPLLVRCCCNCWCSLLHGCILVLTCSHHLRPLLLTRRS